MLPANGNPAATAYGESRRLLAYAQQHWPTTRAHETDRGGWTMRFPMRITERTFPKRPMTVEVYPETGLDGRTRVTFSFQNTSALIDMDRTDPQCFHCNARKRIYIDLVDREDVGLLDVYDMPINALVATDMTAGMPCSIAPNSLRLGVRPAECMKEMCHMLLDLLVAADPVFQAA